MNERGLQIVLVSDPRRQFENTPNRCSISKGFVTLPPPSSLVTGIGNVDTWYEKCLRYLDERQRFYSVKVVGSSEDAPTQNTSVSLVLFCYRAFPMSR